LDSYKTQLFLHIAAAVVGLGPTFVYPFLQGFAERNGVAATRFALQFVQRLQQLVVIPGAILTLLFGIGLIFSDHTGYKDDFPAWAGVAIVWFLLAVPSAVMVNRSAVREAMTVLEGVPDGAPLPADYTPIAKRMQVVGGLFGLSVIAILFLMVWKPGQ
jgi:uncharacterized membrane protein